MYAVFVGVNKLQPNNRIKKPKHGREIQPFGRKNGRQFSLILEADNTEVEESHKERKQAGREGKTAGWFGFSLECFRGTVFLSLEQTCLGNSMSAWQYVHTGL